VVARGGAVQEGAMCVAANVNVDMARGGLGVDDGEVAQSDADEASHLWPRDSGHPKSLDKLGTKTDGSFGASERSH
jgi:hypothetical protein